MAEKKRPLGITILGILPCILGVMSALSGRMLVTSGPAYLGWVGPVAGLILLGLGFAEFVFGLGCFMAWPWAWVMGVALLILGILLQFTILVSSVLLIGPEFQYGNPETETVFGIPILGVILYYVFRPHVRDYFGRT